METKYFIASFVLVPLFGFLASLFISAKNEVTLSKISFYTVGIQLLLAVGFSVKWLWDGGESFNIKEVSIYDSEEYRFLIDFYFDKITAVYLIVGAFVSFLITRYSAYYLHMEAGYKRFFNTILFFFLAYNFTVLAGNFETLFIGWEMLGISSFLLIAFYRERYLPVRNAVKVFSIYRIGDVGILLAMWAMHHLWHDNITFSRLYDYDLVHEQLQGHSGIGIFISLCLLGAAAAKSAQLPFSSWLPRAMEGPTPSSAIFYGSLSVHFGVFLLLRTHPFWEHQLVVRILIGLLGLSTAIVAFLIARVQSTIKTQIAYASISQIGIMFIEVALGFETLALFHFAGNAFLRTYQLLVSPSVVSYMIRDQFYHFEPEELGYKDSLFRRIQRSFYLLSLKEWNLDRFLNKYLFRSFKVLGKKLDFITPKNFLFVMIPAYMLGLVVYWNQGWIPFWLLGYLPEFFSFIGLMLVFKSFSERKHPWLAWTLVWMSHFWVVLAVSFNEKFAFSHSLLYLSGVVIGGIIGIIALKRLKKREPAWYNLNTYYGHVYEHPALANIFLIAALCMMGFPITATFVGEDLIYSHIHQTQFFLANFISLGYVLSGISLMRIYARLFLGPHCKTYHSTPLRSS